jgi:hypothetical protein
MSHPVGGHHLGRNYQPQQCPSRAFYFLGNEVASIGLKCMGSSDHRDLDQLCKRASLYSAYKVNNKNMKTKGVTNLDDDPNFEWVRRVGMVS